MRLCIIRKIVISTFVCLFLSSGVSRSQAYRFRNYGIENNLPGEVVYTLNQDQSGYLWVGTAEGLSRFDGFDFYKVQFPDSSAERYTTVSHKDKNGRLWFGCNDGTLFYAEGSELKQVSLSGSSGTGFSSILEGPDGYIYAIAQRNPLFRINAAKPAEVSSIMQESDPNMFAACFTTGGNLLIGTQENLLICKLSGDSLVTTEIVEGFDYSRITAISKLTENDSFLIGTDGSGIYKFNPGDGSNQPSRFIGYPGLEFLAIKSVFRDSGNSLWATAWGTGLVNLQFVPGSDSIAVVRFLTGESGLAGENPTTVFQDSEENIWIGFNGDGLSMLSTDSFEFYAPGEGGNPNNIIFVGKLNEDYILGTPSGFYVYDIAERKPKSFVLFSKRTGQSEISSYFIDNENNIWIGTKGSGLFLRNGKGTISQFYRSGDTGADYINNIEIDGDKIWLSTLNGVNIVSRNSRSLLMNYRMDTGLPHNSINQILVSEDGSGYVATESDRLCRIDPDSGIVYSGGVMYGNLLNKILGIARDSKGDIWAATQGNGVFECMKDSVNSLSTLNGLLSNYTYSILADREDNIWIGHERGFSRYNPQSGITKVYGTDFAKGGSCNQNGMYESPDGKIFIGTTEGLIIYDGSRDKRLNLPPANNINFITINDEVYPYRKSYSLPYKKRYTVTVSYAGIYFTDPEKVYFSTFLENYDDDWTEESSSREVTYNLSDGKYRFNLISVNDDGLTQKDPLSFELNIKRPFWRAWWFILSLIVLAAAIVVVIVRQREKAQKKIQEYLEKELEARTRVVMKQKAEIELQNLEITDSINYAKRIQSSILPDINRLKEHFEDAFIMLYPRDIVSGDFYWFDRLDNDRFILVCADSTGHGVPGAFMSMIGSTLLQDIVTRQRISKPSEILTMLDKQIFATLNQNLEVGVSNDGMDIVVCEFTLKNRHVRFASAMRPVIIVMGGETYYIKGNRASVGGQTVAEKYFDDQEYYLNNGDMVYIFSDGLPDQFGGPDGKKMKIARLKTLIGELSGWPVSRQEEEFTKFFKEWKGNYEQVDDVLFMGVKI